VPKYFENNFMSSNCILWTWGENFKSPQIFIFEFQNFFKNWIYVVFYLFIYFAWLVYKSTQLRPQYKFTLLKNGFFKIVLLFFPIIFKRIGQFWLFIPRISTTGSICYKKVVGTTIEIWRLSLGPTLTAAVAA